MQSNHEGDMSRKIYSTILIIYTFSEQHLENKLSYLPNVHSNEKLMRRKMRHTNMYKIDNHSPLLLEFLQVSLSPLE